MNSEAHNVRMIHAPVPLPPELVHVSVSSAGSVQLSEVLGLNIQAILIEVLEREGEQFGWVRDAINQALFIKQLQSGVEILIDTSQPTLPVLLRASSTVTLTQIDPINQQLQQLLQKATPEYNFEMNQLLDVCNVYAIESAAGQQGYAQKTLDFYNPETHIHAVEIVVTTS